MPSHRSLAVLVACTVAALAAACANTVEGDATAASGTVVTSAPTTTAAVTTAPGTTTPVTTTQAPAAQVAEYAGGNSGSYYFVSPSTKFECAVITAPKPVAGCHGALPATAPDVPSPDGAKPVRPNAVRVDATGPGAFVATGDPAFHRFDGTARTLPYGSALRVQGFTCAVDERAGVTCASAAGHGFTVSDSAYRLW